MSRSRNRNAGHKWERFCRDALKFISPYLVTTRSESRSRDAMKIDLMNNNEYKNGIFPYEIQCKSNINKVDYHKILNEMPNVFPPIILHNFTEKKGKRFMTKGNYAIMKMDDLIKILKDANRSNAENSGKQNTVISEPLKKPIRK